MRDEISQLLIKFFEKYGRQFDQQDLEQFDELWKRMWLINKIDENRYRNDYNRGKYYFNSLKTGFYHNKIHINLDYFVENSLTDYETPEWEFPKGRRNNNETNKECAIRECEEETNYNQKDYRLIINIRPLSENYRGENNIKYRHIYYIGRLINMKKQSTISNLNLNQLLEVSDIQWLTKEDSLLKIRNYHKTREKVILTIFELINNLNDFNII